MAEFTKISGILADPGIAQLRRYLPVLGVVAAPFNGMGGSGEPVNPLDREVEWQQILEALGAATHAVADAQSAPLALVRLLPPTAARLGEALAAPVPVHGGADAFRVVHLTCHGERDLLYLEDEDGSESYTVAERLVRLFKPGGAQLVVMDGCFSHHIAERLLAETSVKAVVGTRRRVHAENNMAFMTRFYAGLAQGAPFDPAFRAAVGEMPDQGDRFELVVADPAAELTLPAQPGPGPLLDEGMPPLLEVPAWRGFIGRRGALGWLAETLPTHRFAAITGVAGVGKSWLAAAFAMRFSWRFPDGVLWFEASSQTTVQEIAGGVARLRGLDANAPIGQVLDGLFERRFLMVVDGADRLEPTAAAGLNELLDALPEGCAALITAQELNEPFTPARVLDLKTFEPKEARTLAMRLAVERNLDELDVDTIDDFLERTLGLPWLIARGVDLVDLDNLEVTLDELSTFNPDMQDPMGIYLARHLELLSQLPNNPLLMMLRVVEGLPDGFTLPLAEVLSDRMAGARAGMLIGRLVRFSLLRREADLIMLPQAVRVYLRRDFPLEPELAFQRDTAVIEYLVQTWPDDGPLESEAVQRARLNNARAVLARCVNSTLSSATLARLLVLAQPAFLAHGLAAEFLRLAEIVRARLETPRELAPLQLAMGEALLRTGKQAEAGWMFQVTLTLEKLSPEVWAEATRAYARHLVAVGQVGAAQKALGGALRALLKIKPPNLLLAAPLAHDWANILAEEGDTDSALPRFEAALSSYSQSDHEVLSLPVRRDLAAALVVRGEMDRTEETLRQALAIAKQLDQPAEVGRVHRQLALAHAHRAEVARRASQPDLSRTEWENVICNLDAALPALLVSEKRTDLADTYVLLGRAQSQTRQLDDAAANTARGAALYDGMPGARVAALIHLGQVQLARGDSVAAQSALHCALATAYALPPGAAVLVQAAGILLRLHELRARHAAHAGRDYVYYVIDQAAFSQALLAGLDLDNHATALQALIERLQPA